ncbi:PDDEXK nuclease domain-containing protein [Altericista sp. CCNU0014]|uniref:PDDEXK nuclease domain-containing protein n=1 Tax=Altericista sp. CCNU0014 TaxID=3082949 RepID=UPI00384C24E4
MSKKLVKDSEYRSFIQEVKQRIQSAQIKASLSVNQALLQLYWELAERIVEKQRQASWGDRFLEELSRDLKAEFPEMKGFSVRNLKYMRQWFMFWSANSLIGQQLVAQIPWGHNLVILSKIRDIEEALFYVQKTIENGWSRSVLSHHIETRFYYREGKAITNFELRLPALQSDLAKQLLKDPYNFDFLMLRKEHDEKELEDALVAHMTRFLLELGAGFSYLGRQYRLVVSGDEFFVDLLFYHVRLHCYVVVELKAVKFNPEFVGKLNFYISAVDDLLRTEGDKPTIGLLICKSKNDVVVEYALRDLNKPIGVSEYLPQDLLENWRSALPTIEEIEAELGKEVEEPFLLSELRRSHASLTGAEVEIGGLAADTLTPQEKSVMQYFQSNDSMTVKVVGDLLSVKDSRAREILKALTEKGLLLKQGMARSTYYVRVARTIAQAQARLELSGGDDE